MGDALKLALVHFVGLSMGGFVGMRIAARRPELLKSLTLLETSADPEPTENLSRYRLLQFIGRWFGPRYIVNGAVKILFGQKSLYPVHVMTRKSFGLMMRKLSVTESQRSAQFPGTFSRRKLSVASANWAQVA